MEVSVPERGKLLQIIAAFCKVNPLARPRLKMMRKPIIYQPKDNQMELYAELARYGRAHKTAEPCIVDAYMFYDRRGCKDPYPTSPKWGDYDNGLKAINDAMVEVGILDDDRWVIGGETFQQFGVEDHALIKIYSIGSNGNE